MRRSLLLIAASAVATSACAANTHLGRVDLGTRVRISAPDVSSDRLVGEVASLGPDTVAVRLDESLALQLVPLVSVERIELSRGFMRGSPVLVLAGAAIGTGVGVAVVVDVLSEDCDPNAPFGELCGLNTLAWLTIPTFGSLGAFAGWLVGQPFTSERWRQVPLDQLRVGFAPQPDGRFAFGASVRF